MSSSAHDDDFDQFSVFELAKNKECASILRMVLENLTIYNLAVDTQDEDGNTLLHLVISNQGHYSTVEQLLGLGSNPNKVNNIQETPLHLACQRGNVKLVKLLVEKGGNLHFQGTKLKSLLHLAVEKNNLELCKFLIYRGIDVNCQDHNGSTPLHYAVEQKLPKVTFLLVHKANVNKQDNDGYTPLHTAAKTSSELVKFLQRNKASTSLKTFNGDLPLHLAASSGNLEAAVVLLNGEVKLNDLNNENYTPVKLAEINGHEKVRQLLLRNSSSPTNGGPSSKIPKIAKTRTLHGNVNSRISLNIKTKVRPSVSA